MAKLVVDIDESVLKDISYIDKQFDNIFGGMTQAGAEVVYKNVISALMLNCRKCTELHQMMVSTRKS